MILSNIKLLSGQDINNMSFYELTEVAIDATRISKQRMSLVKNYISTTPAIKGLLNSITKLPNQKEIAEMNINELRHLVKQETIFLNSQTSTTKGAREWVKNIAAASLNLNGLTERQKSIKINQRITQIGARTLSDMFDKLDRIREINPTLTYQLGSKILFETYVDEYLYNQELSAQELEERINNLYEETIRSQSQRFSF